MTSTVATSIIDDKIEMFRPLMKLPELPDASAVRAVRAKAKSSLGMSDRAAGAMSTIWVYPGEVLPQLDRPRRMRIPGGDLRYIEGLAWTPRLMADFGNPRNAADHIYPLAGSADAQDTALPAEVIARQAELDVTLRAREDLIDALSIAMSRTREKNTPYPPISEQGIMDAPFGVMAVMKFSDGSPEIAVPHVREGSTRISHAAELLGITPEDTLLRFPSAAKPMKAFLDEINAAIAKPLTEVTEAERARARCATVNFILIVGFEADPGTSVDLAEAVKVKVAQEHLNTKVDWSGPAQNAVMADECLNAAFNAGVLGDATQLDWLMGRLTRQEAAAAKLGTHADDRFAKLIWLFTTSDAAVHDAIRRPIAFVLRKEPGRRGAVRRTAKQPLAVELTAREFRGSTRFHGDAVIDRITKVLANGAEITKTTAWKPTDRSLPALAKAAQQEQRAGTLGPAGIELGIRALYYAATFDIIRVARNDKGPKSDRRTVAEVLEDMLATRAGIDQLVRIIEDGRRGKQAELRDPEGAVVPGGDGQPVPLSNEYVRYLLFPRTDGRSGPGDSEAEVDSYVQAQKNVGKAIQTLVRAVRDLEQIQDDSGSRMVETHGLVPEQAKGWKKLIGEVGDKFDEWRDVGWQFAATAAEPAKPVALDEADDTEGDEPEAETEGTDTAA